MATHTASLSTHQTIALANTAETITLGPWLQVEVANWDTAAKLYFTVDGSTPTVGGDNTCVVGPGTALQVAVNSPDNPRGPVVVKLICANAGIAYTVTGINP